MNKKKFLAMLLTAAMALSVLAGCGSKETTTPAAPAESGEAEGAPYKIALIQQHQTNAFQIAVTEAAEAKAAELGVELTILSADQDAATQITQIEQCVSEGFNAILFEPVDPDGLRDAAKAAADAGVVVINIVSSCTDWEDAGISAVSCGNNVKAGENEMQHVADLLGGKGNVAILTGPAASSDALDRLEGYENILANHLVYMNLPWVDDRLKPEQVRSGLCLTYAAMRAIGTAYTLERGSRDDLADALAGLFRLVEHSPFYFNAYVLVKQPACLLAL